MKNIYIDFKRKLINDTGKYALQINSVFGLFDTLKDARDVYEKVISQWDSIKAVVVGVESFVLGDRLTVVFESGEENDLEAELFELLERPKCFQMESNNH